MTIKPQHIIIGTAAFFVFMKMKMKRGLGKIEDYGKSYSGRIDEFWGLLKPNQNLTGKSLAVNPEYASPEWICKKFKLSGLEYGNWMSQQDRVNHTVALTMALFDLAKCLKIQPSKIGQNYSLSIGLGARGKSKAAAHYEPGKWTINLTKTSGDGALAHEYGHFLDNLIGYRILKGGRLNFASGGRSTAMSIMKDIDLDSVRGIFEKIIDKLYYKENGDLTGYGELQKDATDYYRRRTEVFARLTETIVQMRLRELGTKNKYLQDGFGAYMPPANLAEKVMPLYFKLVNKVLK
jgi:hypothetical protein